jgi:RNA polymerase I-specific transcription initiation factor RRN7
VQLIVLIIIATKLHYPFDDLKRYPSSNKEPAALTMDWTRWEQAQTSFNHDSHFGKNIEKEAAILVKDKDVMHMSTDQLDHYMDWYADNWLDSSREPGRLAEMFSIQRAGDSLPGSTAVPGPPSTSAVTPSTPQEKIETMLYKAMQDIRPRRVIPEEDEEPTRPGEIYRRYRWESQLSGAARTFYEIAARLAAVPLKTLVRAVTLAEYRIAKDDEKRQHREYFENQGVAVDESDDDEDYVMDEGGSDEEDNED